jgi:hypothetical protein
VSITLTTLVHSCKPDAKEKKTPTDQLWPMGARVVAYPLQGGARKRYQVLIYHKKGGCEIQKIGGGIGDDQGVQFYRGTTTPDGITSGHKLGQ